MTRITEPTAKTREYLRRKRALHKQLRAEVREAKKVERERKKKMLPMKSSPPRSKKQRMLQKQFLVIQKHSGAYSQYSLWEG